MAAGLVLKPQIRPLPYVGLTVVDKPAESTEGTSTCPDLHVEVLLYVERVGIHDDTLGFIGLIDRLLIVLSDTLLDLDELPFGCIIGFDLGGTSLIDDLVQIPFR